MLQKQATKTTTMVLDGANLTPDKATVTYDTDIGQDLYVPACCVAKQYTITIPIANIYMFALAMFQVPNDPGAVTEPVTVQFNAGPSPTPDSFELTEENGLAWVKNDLLACPLHYDVVSVLITNPNTSSMVVQIRAGVIATVTQ